MGIGVMVWFLADTHFGYKNDNRVWLDDMFAYFYEVLIPYMKRNVKPGDILVHLGDVFDNRQAVGLDTLSRTMDLFRCLSDIFTDIRIVIGNHDMFNKSDNSVSSINMLKYIPNVTIYYEPTVDVIEGKAVLFNSWCYDYEKQKDILKKYKTDYIFGHLEVKGSVTNSKGSKILGDKSIPVESFKKSEVYAGHIHMRQDIKNVHYVGTPYQKDWGDKGSKRGITVLEPKSGKSVFLENDFSPKFIDENVFDILDITIEDLRERWNNNYINLNCGTSITDCNISELSHLVSGAVKELKVSGDNTQNISTDVIEDTGEVKNSIDHLFDFVGLQDFPDAIRSGVEEILHNKISKL